MIRLAVSHGWNGIIRVALGARLGRPTEECFLAFVQDLRSVILGGQRW